MSLAKYHRTPSLLKMFFDDPLTKEMFINERARISVPSANIKEDKQKFTIELALPGMKKEDLKIELEDKVLKVSSEVKDQKIENNEKYHLMEFKSKSYERSFTIPESIERSNISADYTDGVLKLVLPKNDQTKAKAVRQIKVG